MTLPFYKYQGTGNDFIIVDHRKPLFDAQDTQLITRLCDRKFGVGADGLILLSTHEQYDFEMTYYNADATRSMCGNGARCAVDLAHRLEIIQEKAHFIAEGTEYTAHWQENSVRIKMADVPTIQSYPDGHFLNTGTRHFVRQVENLSEYDVIGEGRPLRYESRFAPEGANVNFVEVVGDQVHMRIYEKGVENETLSSGTGVTAVALVLAHTQGLSSPVLVHTRGGKLGVNFEQIASGGFVNIYMEGPAKMVFRGTVFV